MPFDSSTKPFHAKRSLSGKRPAASGLPTSSPRRSRVPAAAPGCATWRACPREPVQIASPNFVA
eukprot:5682403-Alexandrium_andersonii.AAC.1